MKKPSSIVENIPDATYSEGYSDGHGDVDTYYKSSLPGDEGWLEIIRPVICKHYHCSDQNDNQYPECYMFKDPYAGCPMVSAKIDTDIVIAISARIKEITQ